MTSETQGWSGLADDSAVIDRVRDLQRRGVVQGTATVLTTLHRNCVLTLRHAPVATPQQELFRVYQPDVVEIGHVAFPLQAAVSCRIAFSLHAAMRCAVHERWRQEKA